MKVIVFLGPSLALEAAQVVLEADYLPPVSQGDIVTLLEDPPDVIGIIDGYFEKVPAVWHKEILLALSLGVTVLGASSMGALRAAELSPFGMIGVGKIFERYRDGQLVDDDAVAIQHGPAELGYHSLSEALVNIQASLERARETGLLSYRSFTSLMAAAKDFPYWERSYDRLLAAGRALALPAGELAAFQAMAKIDQKRLDALALLERVKDLPLQAPAITMNHTAKLDTLIERDRCLWRGDGFRVTVDGLINCLRLTGRDYLALCQRADQTSRRLAQLERDGRFPPPAGDQASLEARRHLGLSSAADFARWLRDNGLTDTSWRDYLRTWQALRETVAAAPAPGCEARPAPSADDLILQLRLENSYAAQLAKAVAVERCYAQAKPSEAHRLSDDTLYRFFHQGLGLEDALSFAQCSEALGFADKASFAFWMTKLYLYHQTAGAVEPAVEAGRPLSGGADASV